MKSHLILLVSLLLVLTSCSSFIMLDEGKVSENNEEISITFKPIEISDGLYFTERDIIKKESNELVMNLEFESDFFDGEHEFVLNIPKDIAANVKDIEFSEEPDNILNEDPSVSWYIDLEKKHKMIITALIDLSHQRNTEAVDFVAALDYLRFYAKVRQCSRADEKTEECFVQLMTKYKEFIHRDDCAGMSYYPETAACRAYVENNPNYCGSSETCKNILSGLKWENCNTEECRLKASIESGCKDDCQLFISQESKQKCLAGTTQDDSYCNELLPNDKAYDNCCQVIKDDAQRERCLAYNDDIGEEKQEVEIKDESKEDLSDYYCKTDAECPKNYFCNDDGICETNLQEWNPIKYAENKRQ